MPIYSVKGPDGRIYDVQGPEGASDEQIIAFLQQNLAAFQEQKPKEGLIAGLQKGAESTYSQLRSGLGALVGSGEEAAKAGLERGEDIGQRYAQQVSMEKVKQAYADKGLLSAAGEVISQIPYAVSEQLPNLATSIGGARLGALAGSPFGPVGSIVGGTAGLVAPSFLQQLGGNVERQAAEGKPVNVATAAGTAVPQTGLDIAASFIPLGGRLVSKLTGLPTEALLGRSSAQATKLADERLLATLAKGTGTGALAEIPTEITQQMLQRAQAGLSLSSPDALEEYGQTAYQAGLLGPLGAVGRMSEVGGARQQVEQEQALDMRQKRLAQMDQEEKDRAAQEVAAAAEAERRQTPEFALEAEAKYNDIQQEFVRLRELAKGKVDPTDLAAVETQKAAKQALSGFKKSDNYKQVIADYQETTGIRDQLKKQQEEVDRQKAEDDKQKEIALQLQAMQQAPGVQQTIPGLAPMETENVAPPKEEEFVDYAQQARALGAQLDVLRDKAKTVKGLDEKIALGEQYDKIDKARKEAEDKAKATTKPAQQLNILQRKMSIAEEEGDIPAQVALAKKIQALGFTTEDLAQVEIPLAPFKAKSESVEGFETRVNEPQRAELRARATESAQQRLGFVEEEEQAALEQQRRAEQDIVTETERERKIAPEALALRRIAGRPAGAESASIPYNITPEAAPRGSAAMSRLSQELRGVQPGGQGELIPTAEPIPGAPKIQKAEGDKGFRLYPRREGSENLAASPEAISERIARALVLPGLSNETYAFLRRAENVLPRTDNQGVLSLLDKQLTKIETGQEGRTREGVRRTKDYAQEPIGETKVRQRIDETQDTSLRGPSTAPAPLSLEEEITPLLESRERGLAEDQAGQMGLFPEEEKKLGYIKPDRAAFERFMRSPFVNKLRKALRADQETIDRAKKLPELKAQIVELEKKAKEMEKIRLDYSDAARTIQLNRDVGQQRRDINVLRSFMTDFVVERMELQGRLDELKTLRGELIQQGRALGETVELPFLTELNNVEENLHKLSVDSAELDGALNTLEAEVKVEAAKVILAQLNPQRVSKEALDTAKQNLLDAQRAAGVIESEASKVVAKQKEEAARAKRTADAVAAAKSAQERIDASKAEQKRLESMYGEAARGEEYPAISEAKRASRTLGKPVLSVAEQVDIKKNPLKVLGGYRSSITTIEKRLQEAQKTSKEARMGDLEDLLKEKNALDKAYKEAQGADARAEILPKLEAAEKTYDDAARELATEPVTWKGMAKDIRELSSFYQKEEILEEKIRKGQVRIPDEKPSKSDVKPSAAQKKAVAAALQKEQAAEAAKRATAPTTSGEKLTRSEAQKAAKPTKTQYSSKGIGQAELTKQDQERLSRLVARQKAGATLNAFELAFIEQKTQFYPSGINYQLKTEEGARPLSKSAIAELKRGKVTTALDDVSRTSTSKLNREVAQRLKKLLGETKVTLVDNLETDTGEAAYGAASADGMDIWLDSEYGLNEETLLHEAVHAATERILNTPEAQLTPSQLAAKKELTSLYNAIKNDDTITSKNAKASLNEFVAEALSNSALQAQMKLKPWTLQNAWESFKKILMNMLGIKMPDNMLDVALAAVDTLMEAPIRLEAGGGKLAYQKATYVNPDFAFAGKVTDKFVAKNRTMYDKVKANASGLVFETQYVDRFAGFERLSKIMKPLIGTQMMYYLRMYDQRMNFVSQAVGNGALQIVEKTRKDGSIERVIEAGGGASIANTVQILKQATPLVGNGEAVNRLFTMYMSAIRAEDKGFAALHFGEDLTPSDLKAAKASIDKNPEVKKIFDAARAEYNAYNKDMMNFLAQTGAISKETAAALTKNNDYIPWYRERNGVAELVIGSESPIKIGNIKEQPYLQELVGGDRPILDFMTSSVQNTNMLVDMGLRNLSTKNAVIELANMDLAKIGKSPMAGPDIVRFKVDGEDRYAIINTDDAGVPADVLVKGMEGIPTQMPGMFRLLGMPATFLRKLITASPLYAARQLFRDSLAAPILVGADFVPVIGALRQIGKSATKETLERRGITGGQIFTGASEDLSKILRDIASDNSGWLQAFGKLEALNMEADASTRRAQYNSYINQGLSEMEATLMSLESMNFNKRGASPSVHWANSLIPFFNAQIQGLNVLYKAIGGKLPFNEKLKIQRKILLRGGMIAAGTLAYAAAMQEDEAYKNATPEQKYGNWFIRVPGFEEAVRLPIPFEIGYIFKALPEALYNSMVNEHGSEEAVKAFGSILKQLIPGGSSYGIPQAMRPAIEAGLGKSFYTGRDILSAQEKALLPEDQFRENTSEVSKTIGRVAGVSPIILDSLVQGYTGAMGLAFVQAVGLGFPKSEGPEAAVRRLSNMPVVGTAFQPNDAGAIITRVYDRMNEFKKVESSVESLIARGYKAEAMELLNKRGNEYAAAEIADYYTTTMRELTQYENAIKASDASPEQKRQQLDEIRKMKTRFATTVEQATDRTIPR
jgi:hypothetical protein